jgi:site-specific DNA recombinase
MTTQTRTAKGGTMTSKHAAATALKRAVIYVRISRDKRRGSLDEGLGVQAQEEQCRALALRLGYLVIAVFCDNDVSAYSGKPRPQ